MPGQALIRASCRCLRTLLNESEPVCSGGKTQRCGDPGFWAPRSLVKCGQDGTEQIVDQLDREERFASMASE